ncbi:MAG: ral nucleoside transport system permease protein [Thermoleophilaceae bacterium]|jgi:simple sugar transport system permease protein|nr:ral nucleoside transport system permease protein [Thermoleophilaceae bacterium]
MNDSVVVLTLAGAIVAGTPLALAALGELLGQRSGVMNLGVEGMMLVGAVTAILGAEATGTPWLGLALGGAAGLCLALVHAVLAVSWRVNQVVSGLALVILGTGLSSYIGKLPDPPLGDRAPVERFEPVFSGGPADVPILGPILFGHDPIVYLSVLAAVGVSAFLYRARGGLALRAVGESPATADAAGISVTRTRYGYVLLGGLMAGMGGGYVTLALSGTWQDGITAGAGWIAFALVPFASWRPLRCLLAAWAFGALTNLNFTLQLLEVDVPSDLLSMLPFVMTIVVLIAVSARPRASRLLAAPAALSEPYVRETR